METLIINTEPDKMDKIIDFLKSMKVSYEVKKPKVKKEKGYNPEFVKKILDAKNEVGGKTIDPKDPWRSLGLL
jgi:hypothetical protein